jgi:hypothetical protein
VGAPDGGDGGKKTFLTDLSHNKEIICVAKGGSAGKGNKLHPHMHDTDKMGK